MIERVLNGTLSEDQAKWLHEESFRTNKRKIDIVRSLIDKARGVQ